MATLKIRWATAATLTALIVCVCYGIASVFATPPTIAASAIAGDWTMEPPATPVGAQHVVLQAVSCAEATACMAVGYSEESTPGATPLAEMWNGSRWSLSGAVIASPGSDLLGVSCPVAGWCAAVGSSSQEVFAETWNGTVWTKYTIAAPSGSQSFTLLGISCTSPNHCLAVGYYVDDTGGYGKALVEEWNGSTWTEGNAVDPNPRGAPYDATSELYAISCANPTSCVAVGEYEDEPDDTHPALAESWNGSTWTVDSTPTIPHAFQTYLNSVSCWAPGSCMAVGGYNIFGNPSPEGNTVSESWDGSVWHLQSAPVLPETFSELHGVSCASATFCIGLGYGSPGANYVALWNGAWSYETFGAALRAVSCVSQIYCMAVGVEEAAVYVSNPENPLPFGGGGSSSTPPPTTPPSSPSGCPDYMVIDSRGSGENKVVHEHIIPEVSPPGAYFASEFRHRHPSASFSVISNPYPAVGLASNWREYLNGAGAVLHFAHVGAYHDSVVAGKKWLAHEIATVTASCGKTKILLVGYSQGAQVTGDVVQGLAANHHNAPLLAHILGVVLFGDPYFDAGDSRVDRGGYQHHNGLLGERPHFTTGLVLSYCHKYDPICQFPLTPREYAEHRRKEHENYSPDAISAALYLSHVG